MLSLHIQKNKQISMKFSQITLALYTTNLNVSLSACTGRVESLQPPIRWLTMRTDYMSKDGY